MFDVIAAHIQALPLAVQLIGVMVLVAAADFALAVIAHLSDGTFHGTVLGEWVRSKGLPIVIVALLYGLDSAVSIVHIDVGGTDLGAFGALAYAQAVSFIAQEVFSIVKNAKLFGAPDNPPVTEG